MSKSFFLLSAGAMALATPAYAQQPNTTNQAGDNPAPTESPTEQGAVQGQNVEQGGTASGSEIVVTAQGRRQALQDVPLAVSAVSAETLQNSGANDIRQLNQVAPSLLVSSTGSEANGSARIRGIGTVGDNPGLESSVAVFVDGVYRSRSGIGLNELGEIERIEVLRGPQGTLFGRNASAGLLHIISRRPSFNFGGFAEATYGNYDNIRLAGAVTGPLSDALAFRLDAVYNRRDGFYEVVNATGGTEDRVNDRNRIFARGQLLYEPNDALSIRLIGDYTTRDESCCAATYDETRETFDPTPGVPGDFRYATGENRIVTILRRLGGILPSQNDTFNRRIAISPGRTYRNDTTDWGVSGQVDYDFGDVTLTSITAYRGYKAGGAGDLDYGNVDLFYRADDGNSFREFQTFSQELRLQGQAFRNRLNWLVGAYFSNESLELADNSRFGTQYGPFAACRAAAGTGPTATNQIFLDPAAPGCLSTALVPAGVIPGVPGGVITFRQALGSSFGAAAPVLLGALDRLSQVRDVGDLTSRYNQESQNFAVFTHNIFNITDTLSLTVGLRYTSEQKSLQATFNNNNTLCPAQQAALAPLLANPALAATAGGILALTCTGNSSSALNGLDIQDEFDEGEFTGTGILSWQPNRDVLLYASFSRGYKAGGYNLDRSDLLPASFGGVPVRAPTNADAPNLRFASEIVNAYEAGFKLTRRNFTFNAAVFHQEFQDFQLNTFNGTVFIVQNINSCQTDLGGRDRDAIRGNSNCAPGDTRPGVLSTGVELEANLRPSRDLNIGLGYTYANTRYRDNLVGSSAGESLDPFLFLLPGQQVSNAPEHVATASLTYTPELGTTGLTGLVYVDTRLSSDYNTGSDLFPEKEQDGFVLVNARLGVRGPDQRWALEFFAQNIFNEQYQQVAFNTPFQGAGSAAQVAAFGGAGTQVFSAFLAEPRTYGVTARVRF